MWLRRDKQGSAEADTKTGPSIKTLTARQDVRLLKDTFLGEGIGGLGFGGGGLRGGAGAGEGGEGEGVAVRQSAGTAGFDARHWRQPEG